MYKHRERKQICKQGKKAFFFSHKLSDEPPESTHCRPGKRTGRRSNVTTIL